MPELELVTADWPAPPNVRAFVSTRRSGFSEPPYASANLALHVGERSQLVSRNRSQLAAALPDCHAIQWLDQVHGTAVHEIASAGAALRGDGLRTGAAGLACAVLTADCLPVFLTDKSGREVGVVHAGWRGLAAGILYKAVKNFSAQPREMLGWLGPAISQAYFEVDGEVALQLLASIAGHRIDTELLVKTSHNDPAKVMVDLFGVARQQLRGAGLTALYGGSYCTYRDSTHFYSYRRAPVTGRMASVIYRV